MMGKGLFSLQIFFTKNHISNFWQANNSQETKKNVNSPTWAMLLTSQYEVLLTSKGGIHFSTQ
jgi:hypothetical protein